MFVKKKILLSILILILTEIQAENGCITLESQPSRAAVYIDNEHAGTTPLFNHYLQSGHHSIRFVNESDNVRKLEIVEIIADTCISLSVDLEKERGTIEITTKPAGAAVTIIRQLGTTPLNDPEINPGGYTLLLSPQGKRFKDSVQTIEIRKNEVGKMDISFKKDMRYLRKRGFSIGLGILSLGTYIWGFCSSRNDHKIGAYVGFSIGSLSLLSLSILSLM